MLTVGRVCVKTAGRDAREYCVIVEEIDATYVLVDGNTRRKKVNKAHLEPLSKTVSIKSGAETKVVLEALEKLGIAAKKSSEPKAKKEKKAQVKKEIKKKDSKKASKK